MPNKKEKRETYLTHSTVPATVGLVDEVRKELKADIRALGRRVEKGFAELRGEIQGTHVKIHGVDAKLHGIDAKIHGLHELVHEIQASTHRTQTLMEEQRAENKIVLDGLKTVLDRQDRVEVDVNSLRVTIESLKARNI